MEQPELELDDSIQDDFILSLSDIVREKLLKCSLKDVAVLKAIISGEYKNNTQAFLSVYPKHPKKDVYQAVSRIVCKKEVKELLAVIKEEKISDGLITRSELLEFYSRAILTNEFMPAEDVTDQVNIFKARLLAGRQLTDLMGWLKSETTSSEITIKLPSKKDGDWLDV
jgi:hypothetical protein